MKKLSRKGLLLLAGTMAVCAFAMPSMASASSWGSVGTHHTLTSSNLGFTSSLGAAMGTGASFTARVLSTGDLQITQSTFASFTMSGPLLGECTLTFTGTNFPWTATAVTTSNIEIHGVDIAGFFHHDHEPGSCNLASSSLRITGTLRSGRWTGNSAGQHSIELLGASGLVSHSPLGTTAIAPTGTIGDSTLTVTN